MTHVRFNIFPDGGVSRLRLWGELLALIDENTADRTVDAGAFAPFGDVIELDGATPFPINLGTTERYHDLAKVDVTEEGGRPLINLFRGQPRALPFEITMMERHPLGSQAFIPLTASRIWWWSRRPASSIRRRFVRSGRAAGRA